MKQICLNNKCEYWKDIGDEKYLAPGGYDNFCILYEDVMDCQDYIGCQIVCNGCGLPIELCMCDNPRIIYDKGKDKFIDTRPND
jgi:hypothetical protein